MPGSELGPGIGSVALPEAALVTGCPSHRLSAVWPGDSASQWTVRGVSGSGIQRTNPSSRPEL